MKFEEDQWLFSPNPNPYDSLVFSRTSQNLTYNKCKADSLSLPKQTILVDSREQQISRQLINLQNKLIMLQGQVQQIKTDRIQSNKHKNFNQHQNYPLSNKQNIQPNNNQPNITQINITNMDSQKYQIGKIRKGRWTSKPKVIGTKNYQIINTPTQYSKVIQKSFNNLSIRSQQSQTAKDCTYLKKQMGKLKIQAHKNSKSSQKLIKQLSHSKEKLKKVNSSKYHYEKIIEQLTKKLNQSQAIRSKQKAIMLSQKSQIQELRLLLKTQPKILRY